MGWITWWVSAHGVAILDPTSANLTIVEADHVVLALRELSLQRSYSFFRCGEDVAGSYLRVKARLYHAIFHTQDDLGGKRQAYRAFCVVDGRRVS